MMQVRLLFTTLITLALPTLAIAQPRPIGEQYREVSAVLTDIGAKSVVYLPVNKDDQQLFYIPFFAMKADKDGKLEVAVQNGTTPTTKVVSVWLLLSPQNKLEAIADYVRAQEFIKPIDKRFADVQVSQLVGIPFMNLDVAEEGSRVGFRRVNLSNYAVQGELQLDAEVPAADADNIADDLRKGDRLPTFVVRYDLNARVQLSQSQIQADMRYFQETKGVKDLLGAPKTSEKFGWKVGSGGVQLEQPFLTRDQRGTFEGQMKSQVKVLIELENDRDAVFLLYMQDYFGKVLQRTTLDTDKTPLGRELANMSAYDFDAKDLRPDEIDQMVADVKNFFSQESADEKTFKVGASASFAGFGGAANFEYTGKTLRKMMEDKGWKFEAKGKFTVPRSFEVHVLNTTALKTEGVYSLTVARYERGFMRLNHQVSTRSVYYPQGVADQLVAFEKLKAKVAKIDARKAHVGSVRIWHVTEGVAWKPMLDPKVKADGPSGERTFRKWVAFPETVQFDSNPSVVVGVTSFEAIPARGRIVVSKVTPKGFEVTIMTWHDTVILELDFSYVALPK